MFDIITFGSATWDIFLKPEDFEHVEDAQKFITSRGVCFNAGSKIDVKEIHFSSGGGGTNAAATFAKQGFRTAYCGVVGDDIAGLQVAGELKALEIDSSLLLKTKKAPTNHSIVLSGMTEDRIIFVYKGASQELTKKELPLKKIAAKWIYLAPLSGKLCEIFSELVSFAKNNGIKIAVNPGNTQLEMDKEELKGILSKVDVLIMNQEEASRLTGADFAKSDEVFEKFREICPGICIMTKGSEGVVVADQKNIYSAGIQEAKVVDRTGAGDAFASGFVSEYILSDGDVEAAIQLGTANACSCLGQWGAKAGLLEKNQPFERIKVEKK